MTRLIYIKKLARFEFMTRQDLAAGENDLVSSQVVAKVDHL